MSDSDIILSAIGRKGWQTAPADGGWHCYHPETDQDFFLSFTPSWVCFHKPVAHPLTGSDAAALAQDYRALLQHNEAMFLARYALDPASQPVLLAELPRSSGLPVIETALATLARYADPAGEALEPPGDSGPVDRAAHNLAVQEQPGLAEETIAYYVRAVEAQGWGMRAKPSGITWPLGYEGQRSFPAYFTVSQSWAYFHVPVLSDPPAALSSPDPAVQAAFLRHLLRLNETWYMAKLGLSASGLPIMMLEVPTQELDIDLFRLCTRLIASYLSASARELQIMAELERDHRLKAWLLAG